LLASPATQLHWLNTNGNNYTQRSPPGRPETVSRRRVATRRLCNCASSTLTPTRRPSASLCLCLAATLKLKLDARSPKLAGSLLAGSGEGHTRKPLAARSSPGAQLRALRPASKPASQPAASPAGRAPMLPRVVLAAVAVALLAAVVLDVVVVVVVARRRWQASERARTCSVAPLSLSYSASQLASWLAGARSLGPERRGAVQWLAAELWARGFSAALGARNAQAGRLQPAAPVHWARRVGRSGQTALVRRRFPPSCPAAARPLPRTLPRTPTNLPARAHTMAGARTRSRAAARTPQRQTNTRPAESGHRRRHSPALQPARPLGGVRRPPPQQPECGRHLGQLATADPRRVGNLGRRAAFVRALTGGVRERPKLEAFACGGLKSAGLFAAISFSVSLSLSPSFSLSLSLTHSLILALSFSFSWRQSRSASHSGQNTQQTDDNQYDRRRSKQ